MSKRKAKSTTGVFSARHPQWLDEFVPDTYEDYDLFQIILFFVFHSPCSTQSHQRKSLIDYGWGKNCWIDPAYLENKLNAIIWGGESPHFFVADKKADFAKIIDGKGFDPDFHENRSDQRIALVKAANQHRYMSLFHHIRNSLAHGRLAMYPSSDGSDVIFVMEDGSDIGKKCDDKFEVTARIVLLKSVLLRIAQCIKNGPQDEMPLISHIKAAIRAGINTKGKLIEELQLDEKKWNATNGIKKLMDSCDEIYFEKGKWHVQDKT